MSFDFGSHEVSEDVKTALNEQFDSAVKTALEKETAGLKAKNQELLEGQATLKSKLSAFDGMDPTVVKDMMKQFQDEKEQGLFKEGKFQELLTARLEANSAKFNDQIDGLNKKLEVITGERDGFQSKYRQAVVSQEIGNLALKTNIRPTALDDIQRRAMEVFSVDEEGKLEAIDAKGKPVMTADGKLLTPERFLENLRQTCVHYWPDSEASGLQEGESGGSAATIDKKIQAAAEAGNQEEYERLVLLKRQGKTA